MPLKTTAADMNPSLSSDANFSDPCANTTHLLMALFWGGVYCCASPVAVWEVAKAAEVCQESEQHLSLIVPPDCWKTAGYFSPPALTSPPSLPGCHLGHFGGECAAF